LKEYSCELEGTWKRIVSWVRSG